MTGAAALAVTWALWPPVTPAPPSADDGPQTPVSLQSLAAQAGGIVGFAAVDLRTGQWMGLRVDQPFPTQSVFKLPVALEVLHEVDEGQLRLDQVIQLDKSDARQGAAQTLPFPCRRTIRELLEAMLIVSDNAATDKLLALIGGPARVDARLRALGVTGISIRYSELEMTVRNVDNTATPRATLQLLRKIRTKDGITDATNDVGLVTSPDGRRIAIAAFVHASPADEATRENVIATLAREAYDRYLAPVGIPASVGREESIDRYPAVAPTAHAP